MDYAGINMKAVSDMQTAFRRDVHRHPENAWTEFRTTCKILEKLEEFGIPYLCGRDVHTTCERYGLPSDDYLATCRERALAEGASPEKLERMEGGYTGAIGIIDTGRPGPVTALRFDIDCIDACETTDPAHKPNAEGFASVHPNLFHGCGHDSHTAIGIGAACLLSQCRDQLSGKVYLVFQPGEEGLRGGASVAECGLFEDVDNIMACHVAPGATGTVVCGVDGFAISVKYDLHYEGVPSHAGAAPQVGRNALLAAANAAINIMGISRTSEGYTRVNVGTLNAGTGRNVIPAVADMKCEVRGGTQEACDYMAERLLEVGRAAGDMFGCRFSYSIAGKVSEASSDKELSDVVRRAAEETEGVAKVTDMPAGRSSGGSEDFASLMSKVQSHGGKATFFIVTAGSEFPNHHDHFDVDERMLNVTARVFCNAVGILNAR